MARKIRCYALTDKRGRFIHSSDPQPFQQFSILTFRTAKAASQWVLSNSYWRGNAFPMKVKITIEGVGP